MKVRGFTQDDVTYLFDTSCRMRFRGASAWPSVLHWDDDYRIRVSLRDPESDKYVGAPEAWDKAEAAREAVKTLCVEYEEELGEAALA